MGDLSLGDDFGISSPTTSGTSVGFDIPSAPVGAALHPLPSPQQVVSPSDIPRPPFSSSPTPPPTSTPYVLPPPSHQQQFSQQQQQNQQNSYPQHSAPTSGGGYHRPGYVAALVPAGSPVSNSDPRIKDSIELCNFAIAALKVRCFMLY